jgi:hypothetical protein
MITTRQLLRFYSKDKDGRVILRKLFKLARDEGNINDTEYWLLIYAYAERRMVENTCAKLAICQKTYHIILNQALIKINYTICKLDKMYTL